MDEYKRLAKLERKREKVRRFKQLYHATENTQIKTVTKETELENKRLKKELAKANESLSRAEHKLDIMCQFVCDAP